MATPYPGKSSTIDFSIIYSFKCDLSCSFCMYNSDPFQEDVLDLEGLKVFLSKINWIDINSIGFYGGEATLFLDEYEYIRKLIPQNIPIWCLTNGTWSRNKKRTKKVLDWASENKIKPLIVSSTIEHIEKQDRSYIYTLNSKYPCLVQIKKPEEKLISMGRLADNPSTCTKKCDFNKKPTRIAITPFEKIIYQTCDGSYPIIATSKDSWEEIRKKTLKWNSSLCPNVTSL